MYIYNQYICVNVYIFIRVQTYIYVVYIHIWCIYVRMLLYIISSFRSAIYCNSYYVCSKYVLECIKKQVTKRH